MSYRDILANQRREVGLVDVDDGVVLDVGSSPDPNFLQVGSQHRAVPHARIVAEVHVTHDDGRRRYEDATTEARRFAGKRPYLHGSHLHSGRSR